MMLWVFIGVTLLWLVTRLSIGALPELFHRAFWVVIVALLVVPAFLLPHSELANQIFWPLAAGLASGEVLAQGFWRKRAAWQIRQQERQAKRERLAAEHAAQVQEEAAAEARRVRRAKRTPPAS